MQFLKHFFGLLTLAALVVTPLIADTSGSYSNNSGTYTVKVEVSGGIHGDYKVKFTDANGSRTVLGTPDQAGGAGDVIESDEAVIYKYDDDGEIVGKTTYRIRNGRVEYRIGDQTTWRRMYRDRDTEAKGRDAQLLVRLEQGVSLWSDFGDDTIGSLPDQEGLNGQ